MSPCSCAAATTALATGCRSPTPMSRPWPRHLARPAASRSRRSRRAAAAPRSAALRDQPGALDLAEHGVRDGRGERVAAEGRAVRARRRTGRSRAPKVISAPIGKPPPMPFATVMASGAMPACWKANHSPVRPAPVWISSMISSAPCRSVSSRAALRGSPSGRSTTPASPLIGSTKSAATRSSIAASSASIVESMCSTPGGIGRNGSCMYGLPVRASVPIVRPWKASVSARMRGAVGAAVQAGELERGLVGLGAGVAEVDAAAHRPCRRAASAARRARAAAGSRSSSRRARGSRPGARPPRRRPDARGRAS